MCFNYTSNGIYTYNQSNQITTALANAIEIINGSYCREKVMEFLCYYFFPPCENDTSDIVPICEQSCNEHLITGICASHLLNVLTTLNSTDYVNVSVDRLIQEDCPPPHDITVSDNCTLLTSGYTR